MEGSAPQVITRRQAIDAGLVRYFTGKPCGRGHLAERYTLKGSCILCERASLLRHKDAIRRRRAELHGEAAG